MSFLMIWIMYAGGFSTYARYHILLSMTWFIKIFFFMSDNCKFSGFRVSPQIFFLLFPSFVVVAQLCCRCLYWTLAIFPCILFCYTLCQCLAILYALASFWDVLGSCCFSSILLHNRQKKTFSVSFCLLQYLWCNCFVLYSVKIFLQIKYAE